MSSKREDMLKKIQCNNFAAYDMLLYLDTHSDDKKAFKIFQGLVAKTNSLRKEFEESYGPTSQFGAAEQESFNWLDNPWPWEKEADE
jgi:spore coat protein JB